MLHRAVAAGVLSDADATRRRSQLAAAVERWVVLAIDREVIERARQPFPIEPVRTLDAMHISTALQARSLVTEIRVLSLDQRVRDNATALGFVAEPNGSSSI